MSNKNKQIPMFSPTRHFNEKKDVYMKYLNSVLEHGYFINGPEISELEDKLSNSWVTLNNDIGSLRITNWSNNLNEKLKKEYDFIIYDVGPSLGALNRTILLGCDYFVTPMGCDTFSIMGIKNIKNKLSSQTIISHHGLK